MITKTAPAEMTDAELNEAVARDVMRWQHWTHLPPFASDPIQMLMLFQWLRIHSGAVRLIGSARPPHTWQCVVGGVEDHDMTYGAASDSLARAICEVALLWSRARARVPTP